MYIRNFFASKYTRWYICLFVCLLFLLLSFKKMYSFDVLVPNLEPYPDTLYYATPAWNLIHGQGFSMDYHGFTVKQIAPPLYSLYLVPFFGLFQDVRSFYIANMILLLGSIVLFLDTTRVLFKPKWSPFICLFLGILLVTNFYFFTIPSLLLAENISIFLSSLGLRMLFSSHKEKYILHAALLGSLFWFVKLSNLFLGISFYILFLTSLWHERKRYLIKKYLVISFMACLSFGIYLYATSFFSGHKNLDSGNSFGLSYFSSNFSLYMQNLMGGDTRSLWFFEKLVSPLVSAFILSGLVISLSLKEWRLTGIKILFYAFSTVLFMSFFYAQDPRYILVVIPPLLLFVGILFSFLFEKLGMRSTIVAMGILGGMYFFYQPFGYKNESLAVSIKKQIGLNLKHREVPWNYIAVNEWNAFFHGKDHPYFATVLPIYYVNLYTNNSYSYLPILVGQDFFPGKHELASQMHITSPEETYRALLKEGKQVYITHYYINNLPAWQTEYDRLKQSFEFTPVHEGCLGSCSIYQLHLKK